MVESRRNPPVPNSGAPAGAPSSFVTGLVKEFKQRVVDMNHLLADLSRQHVRVDMEVRSVDVNEVSRGETAPMLWIEAKLFTEL